VEKSPKWKLDTSESIIDENMNSKEMMAFSNKKAA
jgi:hypothetical protein